MKILKLTKFAFKTISYTAGTLIIVNTVMDPSGTKETMKAGWEYGINK